MKDKELAATAIAAGILGGPAAAIYVESDTLTTGHKIMMRKLVRDSVEIAGLIQAECWINDHTGHPRPSRHEAQDAEICDKLGGTS